MEIRTLRRTEREPLLRLLDHWEVGDGWRGADFFRRYQGDEPSFLDDQVWVAAEGENLLSCVQVFPRPLQTPAGSVPMGGIGTVFTHPEARARGLAGSLLESAAAAMKTRGDCLSMLFTARIPWYTKHGWHSIGLRRVLLERAPERASESPPVHAACEVSRFVPERDLASVRALHEAYSSLLPGTVVRDDVLWDASLRNAGNPDEEFVVVRSGGECVAYLRAVVLSGILVLSEFASSPGFDEALAGAVLLLLEPRDPDPLATGDKPSSELRRFASTVSLHFAPDFAAALARSGVTLKEHGDPSCMLRCLDAGALGVRLGVPPRQEESPDEFLRRMLPPEDFTFWPADRF